LTDAAVEDLALQHRAQIVCLLRMRQTEEAVGCVMNLMHERAPEISERVGLPLLLVIDLGSLDVQTDALLAGHANATRARGCGSEHSCPALGTGRLGCGWHSSEIA